MKKEKKRLVALVALMVVVVFCTHMAMAEGAPGKILIYRVVRVETSKDRCQRTEFQIELYTTEPRYTEPQYSYYVEPDQPPGATVRKVKVWYSPDGTPLKWEYEDDDLYETGELISLELISLEK